MKVWITKWALTRGIEMRTDVRLVSSDRTDSIMIEFGRASSRVIRKPHWHSSLEDAQVQAEAMRRKEVARLKRRLKVVKTMAMPVVSEKR